MDYYNEVQKHAEKKYGKENISAINRIADKIGVLGGTEITLKDGNKKILFFHYQLEKVCVEGEPWW